MEGGAMHLRSVLMALMALTIAFSASAATPAAAEKGVKQPVFLLCPHAEGYSAWSLYVMVDEQDPQKILSLGLEKLSKKNSKDSSYDDVVAAQSDPKVQRERIGSLDA